MRYIALYLLTEVKKSLEYREVNADITYIILFYFYRFSVRYISLLPIDRSEEIIGM